MKTAEEILQKNTGHAYGLMGAMVIKSMEEYARQMVECRQREISDLLYKEGATYIDKSGHRATACDLLKRM